MRIIRYLRQLFLMSIFFFFSFFFPGYVFAQTIDTTQPPIRFDLDIPHLGTIAVDQPMIEKFGIAVVTFTFSLLLLGVILFFWSVLKRFKKVPRDQALSFGWKGVRDNIPFFAGITLLSLVCSNLFFIATRIMVNINPSLVTDFQKSEWYVLSSLIVGFLLSSYVTAGIISLALQFSEKGRASIVTFFVSPLHYLNFLVGNIVYTIGILIGALLFIIPGAWFGSRFFFWPYLILSKRVSFIDAFRESARMSKGASLEIFLFWFLSNAITLLGIAIMGIGYLVTFPMISLATAYIYRNMIPGEKQ